MRTEKDSNEDISLLKRFTPKPTINDVQGEVDRVRSMVQNVANTKYVEPPQGKPLDLSEIYDRLDAIEQDVAVLRMSNLLPMAFVNETDAGEKNGKLVAITDIDENGYLVTDVASIPQSWIGVAYDNNVVVSGVVEVLAYNYTSSVTIPVGLVVSSLNNGMSTITGDTYFSDVFPCEKKVGTVFLPIDIPIGEYGLVTILMRRKS